MDLGHTLFGHSIVRYNRNTMETWRPVVGYELYEVSSLGRVRSWHKAGAGGKKFNKPLVMHQQIDRFGRLWVRPYILCIQKIRLVHQLVLEAFVGPRKEGMETRHLDGDPANNRLENLRWGTPLENAADKIRHGTTPWGERNGSAVLTELQVRKILASKKSAKALAKRYDVSRSAVLRIRNGRTWKHLRPTVALKA